MDCILCGKMDQRLLGTIAVRDLARIYSDLLGSDMADEFNGLRTIEYVACGGCGVKFFSPPVTGSRSFYDTLSRKKGSGYYQQEKSEYRTAGRFIGRDDRVLDVGSGRGLFSRYVPGAYTGLDFNPAAVEQAAKDGINVLNESIERHAGALTSLYSVVTAFQVLEHVAEPRGFIEGCLSALRPGGLLVLSVPSDDSFVTMLENAALNMPPHHVSRWADEALFSLQDLFNLELVALEHERLEPIHFDTFITLLSQQAVRSLLGWKRSGLLELSLRKSVIDKVSRRLHPFLRRIYAEAALWPAGHSVTAVYRKKQATGPALEAEMAWPEGKHRILAPSAPRTETGYFPDQDHDR